MWGRLLTSIFPSERSEGTDGESGSNRDSMDGATDLASQQRLLFSHSNLHQSVNPLFQQQLFFYADEIPDMARVESEHIRHEGNEDGARRTSTSDSAVETSRESIEMIGSGESIIRRPSTPNVNGTEGNIAATRPSESVAKISVSSLALSSPPSYWEAAVKYQGWPTIDPRPEQGQEPLPRYTCTVFREGCVNRKTELVGNWRPYRRPWKRTFAHLRGTSLRLYAVDMEDVPRLHVRNISLQMARCEIAADYKQRSNVIRIRACDRTILLECKDRIDTLTWLEHLQAAANIATSLEDRCMPRFYTLPRSQSSHPSNRPSSCRSSRTQTSSCSSSSTAQQQQQQQQQQQPTATQANRQLQLQQQLQEHQEQILQQQRQERLLQLHQRQQQVAVQPLESMQPMSPLTSRTSMISTTHSSSNGSRRANIRFGRRSSNTPSSFQSSDRYTDTSLLTRAQRARAMSDEDRQVEAMRFGDDAMMRSVLQALGNSSESEHVQDDSEEDEDDDEEEEDNEEDDGHGTDVDLGDPRPFQGGERVPLRRHSEQLSSERLSLSLRIGPYSRRQSIQELGRSSSNSSGSSSRHQGESDSQDWSTRPVHDDDEHQQRGWNRSLRIFGNLWGHQPQHPRHQRPLSLTAS
ncbi:hypothetical protein BG006_008392 [Podila minutissima]|uniref:PH domain-containing protein n=1 Tax=Podila minutissima TaxID=64525 RepID=A0A9P5SIR7_9FUNG|nr:hypothetical protein BG006_008392 [Podila minutissima]